MESHRVMDDYSGGGGCCTGRRKRRGKVDSVVQPRTVLVFYVVCFSHVKLIDEIFGCAVN